MSEQRNTLHLPAREIPIPTSVSAQAQAILGMAPMEEPEHPPADDVDAWRTLIAARDEAIGAMMAARTSDAAVTSRELIIDGVRVYELAPVGLAEDDRRVYLDIHGGAFVFGRGEACRAMGINTVGRVGARVVSVDYRMPPDHPYPAGLDDCLAVYRELLLDRPAHQIIVGGASAGGNLAAALTLRIRDAGLPLPAAVVLITPAVDLTESGDSLNTNLGLDPLIPRRASAAFQLYAGGTDLRDPFVSPLFGDFTEGFPPVILTTGTRDMLLSDTVRMHRALRSAGIPAALHVTEAGGHGGFFGMAPEDQAIDREIREFVAARWGT